MKSDPPIFRRQKKTFREAFTLVEILVACAILALLVVLVAQMVSSASSVTKASKKRLDADDEARLVLDRMGADFSLMVRRPDINPLFLTNPYADNNDEFYFYSQAPAVSTNAASNNSDIALIGYRIYSNSLQRLSSEQSWDSLSFPYTNVSTNGVIDTGTNSDYHTIGPDIFRMEYALIMKPGSTNNTNGLGPINSVGSYSTNGTNVFFQTNNSGQSMKDVAGIVVALAILDPTSQKIIGTNALSGTGLAGVMGDATNATPSGGLINGQPAPTNGIPAASWKTNALDYSGTGPTLIPKAARSQIRIYQRYFPINL